MRRNERGQSLLELALILPILFLLVVAMVEVGFAMRDYLLVMAANREGVRFASRGRFADETIAQRIVTAGGTVGTEAMLRTHGDDPNTGVIITHVRIPGDAQTTADVTVTEYLTGTLTFTDTRAIEVSDRRVDIGEICERNVAATVQINNERVAAGYEQLASDVIILEVFYAHNTIWHYDMVPLASPWTMYTQSSMRVVTDARQD